MKILYYFFSFILSFPATQAFIIAFSSNFIPRLVYMAKSADKTDSGYLNFTLAYFDPNHFEVSSFPILTYFFLFENNLGV